MSIVGPCPAQPDQITGTSFIYDQGNDNDPAYYTQCSVVTEGICPKAYYCPQYSEADLNDPGNQKGLNQASCIYGQAAINITGNPVRAVVCPCTPGFFCPGNTSEPLICPETFYCPTDTSITQTIDGKAIPSDGLGTWGALSYICPEGYYCYPAQVVPFNCNLLAGSLNNCPAGSSNKNSTALIVLLAIAVGFFYLVFLFRTWRIGRRTRDEEQQMEYIQNKISEELTILENKASQKNVDVEAVDTSLRDDLIKDGDVRVPPVSSNKTFLIEFNNVSLILKNGTKIMNNVSGSFKPSRIAAIMGPSGAGKTTIINLVTGKVARTSGEIKLNGEVVSGLMNIRKLLGFVPQEDVMIRELTVRENIMFSARYRLDKHLKYAEVEEKVNRCMAELGLAHVQHTNIGDEFTRGISGGQRKRVNIAIEMVADTNILFLDEPTSGLDSTTATILVKNLKAIAQRRGMTIASVVHGPSFSAFLEFDDLLLLGKGGEIVYHGELTEAPAYFKSIGFPVPDNTNPADYYLDVISGLVPRIGDDKFKKEDLFQIWRTSRMNENSAPGVQDDALVIKDIPEEENSNIYTNPCAGGFSVFMVAVGKFFEWIFNFWQNYFGCLITLFCDSTKYYCNCKPDPIRDTPGMLTQFWICLLRATKQTYRSFGGFICEMGVHLMIGLVLGTTGPPHAMVPGIPDPLCQTYNVGIQTSCKFPNPILGPFVNSAQYMCFGITFAAIAISSSTFGAEAPNYWREASAGLQTVPYFVAKTLVNVPRIVAAAFCFWVTYNISFVATGNPSDYYATFLMAYWFGYNLGYLVSQLVPMSFVPIFAVMVALIFVIAFGKVGNASGALLNIYKLSGPRWVMEAFTIISLQYYEYLPSNEDVGGAGAFEGEAYVRLITEYAGTLGYYLTNFPVDMWACFLTGVGWGTLGLVIMICTSLDKKK